MSDISTQMATRFTKEELENSIGMQIQFLTISGASKEDTIRRILDKADKYAMYVAASLAAGYDDEEVWKQVNREYMKHSIGDFNGFLKQNYMLIKKPK